MAVLLIKAMDNDLPENLPGKWRRGDVVDARDWDTNPTAPSGSKECPPNFELVTVPGITADEAVKVFCGPMCDGTEKVGINEVMEGGKLVKKDVEVLKIVRRCCWSFDFGAKELCCHHDDERVKCKDVHKHVKEMSDSASARRAAKLQG